MLIIYFGKICFYVQFILINIEIYVYLNKLESIACYLTHK